MKITEIPARLRCPVARREVTAKAPKRVWHRLVMEAVRWLPTPSRALAAAALSSFLLGLPACAPDEYELERLEEMPSSDTLSPPAPDRLLMADTVEAVLRVRDLNGADEREPWEANLLFDTLVTDSLALDLLRDHGALPYAAFALTRWEHRLGGGPAAASETWVEAVRTSALRRAWAVLCDDRDQAEPSGVHRAGTRGDGPGGPSAESGGGGADASRRLLADLEAAQAMVDGLPDGQPILYALRVRASAGDLRRLAADPRVGRLEPALREGGVPALPDVEPPNALVAEPVPATVHRLDDADVRARIERIELDAPCGLDP